MKRWHEDYNHSLREWKENSRHNYQSDLEVGRFRKRKSLDCGKASCGICHSDKFPKREITRKEDLANRSFKEQMKEI